MSSNKDPIQTDDPEIVEKLINTQDEQVTSTTANTEDQEIRDITFKLSNGAEATVSEGDHFINNNGCIVGEVDRIRCSISDIVTKGKVTHWVYIDYSQGKDSKKRNTGGCPLGEVAKQMNEGSMTLRQ